MSQASEISSTNASSGTGRVIGWAIYLAMSWTWCIGMFLPVLLMRELGIVGVIAFAVPNIVGAAVMGWVIRSADQSREMIGENQAACVWFSLITIIYQVFFAAWLIRRIIGPAAGIDIAIVFALFWFILQWRRGGEFLSVYLALFVSLALMGWGYWRADLPYIAHPVEGMRLPTIDNLWLAPAWVLGFACCPYLDLTFHAARQALGKAEARSAFTIGFCAMFTFMLLLTVGYSGWLAIGFDRTKYPQLAIILAVYLIVQICLTCALHAQQVARVERKLRMGQFLGFSAILVVAVLLGVWDRSDITYNGIALGEVIYRAFLGFYGLVVPAYVWLRVLRPRRSPLRVWTVIILAAPLFWLGFANERMILIVPGVLIVVVARFLPDAASRKSAASLRQAQGREGGR